MMTMTTTTMATTTVALIVVIAVSLVSTSPYVDAKESYDVNAADLKELQQLSGEVSKLSTFPGFNFSSLPKPDVSEARCKLVKTLVGNALRGRLRAHLSNSTLASRDLSLADASLGRFFRLSAPVFYHDMYKESVYPNWAFSTKRTRIFLGGNVVPQTFGAFLNSRSTVVYGLITFEDAFIGDYQLDLWRMATGIVNTAAGFHMSRRIQEDLVNKFSRAYFQALRAFAPTNKEQGLVFSANNTYGGLDEFLNDISHDATSKRAEAQYVHRMAARGRFHSRRVGVNATDRVRIIKAWPSYTKHASKQPDGYYTIKDMQRHGALGEDDYLVLIEGNTKKTTDDVVLHIKRANTPAWMKSAPKSVRQQKVNSFANNAKRIITANLALDVNVDPHLGWFTIGHTAYVVSELDRARQRDHLPRLRDRRSFQRMAQQWGTMLATFHARSDRDFRKNYIGYNFEKNALMAIGNKFAAWQKLILRTTFGYHRQVVADYRCVRGRNQRLRDPHHRSHRSGRHHDSHRHHHQQHHHTRGHGHRSHHHHHRHRSRHRHRQKHHRVVHHRKKKKKQRKKQKKSKKTRKSRRHRRRRKMTKQMRAKMVKAWAATATNEGMDLTDNSSDSNDSDNNDSDIDASSDGSMEDRSSKGSSKGSSSKAHNRHH